MILKQAIMRFNKISFMVVPPIITKYDFSNNHLVSWFGLPIFLKNNPFLKFKIYHTVTEDVFFEK